MVVSTTTASKLVVSSSLQVSISHHYLFCANNAFVPLCSSGLTPGLCQSTRTLTSVPCEASWTSFSFSIGCRKPKTFIYLYTSSILRYCLTLWHTIKGGISKQSTMPDVLGFSLHISGVSTDQNITRCFQNTLYAHQSYSKLPWRYCPLSVFPIASSQRAFSTSCSHFLMCRV